MDGNVIFQGEVRKATGMMNSPESCAEVILFTTDEDVLALIESHDAAHGLLPKRGGGGGGGGDDDDGEEGVDDDPTGSIVAMTLAEMIRARPSTGGDKKTGKGGGGGGGVLGVLTRNSKAAAPAMSFEQVLGGDVMASRPMTGLVHRSSSPPVIYNGYISVIKIPGFLF